MTPEQLEAHRVRFEQQSGEPEAMKGQRRGDGYANHSDTRTWQAYQCGIADADRAQRAVPEVQGGVVEILREAAGIIEAIDKKHAPENIRWPIVDELQGFSLMLDQQPPQQSAQPVGNRRNEGFESWWTDHGQFLRSGGGQYEKTFAFTAWNAAAAQPVEVQRVPLTDAQISLIAHNEDEGDWNDLQFRDCWHDGFKAGFRSSEAEHGVKPTGTEGGA